MVNVLENVCLAEIGGGWWLYGDASEDEMELERKGKKKKKRKKKKRFSIYCFLFPKNELYITQKSRV